MKNTSKTLKIKNIEVGSVLFNTGSNVAPRAMPFWGVAKTSGVGISR